MPGRQLAPRTNVSQEDVVTPDYFQTVGIPQLQDEPSRIATPWHAPGVVVISQAAAKRFFGTDSVIGRRLDPGYPPELQVVGVVRDVRVNALREAPAPLVFFPLAQRPQEYITSVEARTTGAPQAAIAGIRTALASVDPNLPVRDVMVIEQLLERD